MVDVSEDIVLALSDEVMERAKRSDIHPTDEKVITRVLDEYHSTLYAFVEEEVNRRCEE